MSRLARCIAGLSLSLSVQICQAEATDLQATAVASGEESTASSHQLRVVVGEPAVGTMTGPTMSLTLGFLAAVSEVAPPDTTPPTGTISINNGAAYTNTLNATLALSATDDSGSVTEMQFSDDGLSYTTPEPYATTKAWTLPTGDGTKTVYAKFADAAGNWSDPASDTITLDTVPPPLNVLTPRPDSTVTGAPAE